MSAYSGTPTVVSALEEGDRNGVFRRARRHLTLSLTAQGGTSNNIPVTALGIKAGYAGEVRLVKFTDGSANVRWVGLFTDGTYVYVSDPTQATDANRGLPSDVTGTLELIVLGLPS